MIKLFRPTDKDFSSNGDKIIIPKRAIIHKEDNGSFYLDLETDLSYIDDFTFNSILVCNTPQGDQAFRIRDINPTNRKISLKANHIFYDSENYLIKDSYVVDKSCNDALDHLNNATDNESPFTTVSNVTTINSYRCVRKSLRDAIKVILERWGGHLIRDNFTIRIMDSIGEDNDVVVRYAKNLKDISVEYEWGNVVTKIMPVGQDGLLLPEEYIESDVQYDIPYTKAITFSQNIDDSQYRDENGNLDEEAYLNALIEDLRLQATNYVAENCIPIVNYTLSANLEKISDIGDVIQVKDERLGVDVLTHVISYDYDAILEKYIEIEFGNFTQQLNELIPDITASTDQHIEEATNVIKVTLGDEINEATSKLLSVLGGSYLIYDGDKLLVVDSLPKETARNVILINSAGIGFSQSGINGPFQSAWTIDNVLNMEQINVINLTADLIKGGTLKLGSNQNQNGVLEVYDEQNNLIAELNKNGLKMFGVDGSYILMNTEVGFSGYDRNGSRIYWVDGEEFHQKKSVVEEEITLCGKMRYIPIQRYEDVLGENIFDSNSKTYGHIHRGYFNKTRYHEVISEAYLVPVDPNTTYRVSKTITTGNFRMAYSDKTAQEIINMDDSEFFAVYGETIADSVNEVNITTNNIAITLIITFYTTNPDIATDASVKKVTQSLVNDGIGLVSVNGGVE